MLGLLLDPASHTAASVAGWSRPMDESTQVLAQVLDAYVMAHFKSPQPYPRPWVKPRRTSTPEQMARHIAALKARGPQPVKED